MQSNKTMSLLIQNLQIDDDFHNLEVDIDITVEDLKCLLEIEARVPVNDQALFFRNQELNNDSKKLTDCGVSNNDMLTLTKNSNVISKGGKQLN